MRRLTALFALLLSSLVVYARAEQPAPAPPPATAPPLPVDNIGRGNTPRDGEWQFRLGDDIHRASRAYDDSEWEHITANKTWGAQTNPSYTGFAWYRRHLDVAPSPLPNAKLAILMPPV
jgi:hypothetical protein